MPGSPATLSPPAPRIRCWSGWPWNELGLTRAWRVWGCARTCSRVTVAVVDDGFDTDHRALRDSLWHMPGRPEVHGWDFVNDGSDVSPSPERPLSSHGTMVAGIIGGRPDPAAGFVGVAPNVDLMLLRWRSNHPHQAHANPLNMATALRFAIHHGAQIINLSAGIDSTWKSPAALRELRDAFKLARAKDVLVAVAAPNTPEDMDRARYWLPGVYPFTNIIHVTGLCRERRLLGAWGKLSVDLAAPAEDITGPTVGGDYQTGCATSFAAPLVTGALALVWGLLPNLQADQVRRLILRNATSTAGRNSLPEGWGHEFPAKPEGRLSLEFLGEAWDSYRNGKPYPDCFPGMIRPPCRQVHLAAA